jgi:response regulator of citrate/malate metabolism
MPRKNGFDVLEWWQEQPHLSGIRIVVLTSSEEVRDVTKAYKLGAASFLFKSLTYPILSMYQYWRNNIRDKNSRDSVRQALGLC